MMDTNNILTLGDEPVLESEKTITLELLSEEASLKLPGRKLPQLQEVEGKITFNPESWHIFSLPPRLSSATPKFTLDRTKWDLYLIPIRFTLHAAPDGRHYEKLTFLIELKDPQATAFDL